MEKNEERDTEKTAGSMVVLFLAEVFVKEREGEGYWEVGRRDSSAVS